MDEIDRSQIRCGALLIVPGKVPGTWYWECKWRIDGRQRKARLGRAHVDPRASPLEPSAGERTEGWRLKFLVKRGRPGFDFLRPDEAERAMADLIRADADRQAREVRSAELSAPEAPTLHEAADSWIAHRERERGLRASTLAEYRSTLRANILSSQRLAGPLAAITRADVFAWRDELDARRKPDGSRALSRRTINKARTILHGIFVAAMRPVDLGGYGLESNPVRWVGPLAEEEAPPREPLDPAEVMQVWRAMVAGLHRGELRHGVGPREKGRKTAGRKATGPELAMMRAHDEQDATAVLVLAFGGLRIGELAALRWQHIDFAGGRIRVERSYSAYARVETGTKGKEARWTLLPDQVAQPLARMRQRELFAADDDLVFTITGTHLDASAFRRRYKRALTAAGIKRHVRVHDLRHGATTDMRSVFTADHVQRLVGHRDARTAQRYAHARDQQDAASRWSAYLAEQIEGIAG